MKYYDIIIVGGGPAGLSAAVYASRAGRKVLVLEKQICGGQIAFSSEVENYPGFINISGSEFASNLMEQAMRFGAEIEYDEVVNIGSYDNSELYRFVLTGGMGEYCCNAVIIATGARSRSLNVPGEAEFKGRGVSYCAVCDGTFYRGRDVAVIGGGNTALEDAIYLSDICNKVYLIHRRNEFRGEPALSEQIRVRNNIIPVYNSVLKSILGDDSLKISSVEITNLQSDTDDTIDVSAVFIAAGRIPDTDLVSSVLKLDDSGYIISGEDCKTETEGIFVAGDCRNRPVKQLATAVCDGAVAAINAVEYLR